MISLADVALLALMETLSLTGLVQVDEMVIKAGLKARIAMLEALVAESAVTGISVLVDRILAKMTLARLIQVGWLLL